VGICTLVDYIKLPIISTTKPPLFGVYFMAKRLPTAQQMTDRWVTGMNRSDTKTKYDAAVQNLDVNPMERAAAASDAWLANTANSNAKRIAGLNRVSKQAWMVQLHQKQSIWQEQRDFYPCFKQL
jgi:hypothetical protein